MQRKILTLILISSLASCSAKKVATTEKVVYRDSIITRVDVQRDSVFVSDSVFVKEKGDSVFVTRVKTIYRDRLKEKTDTIYLNKSQTISTDKVATKTRLPWWLWLVCIVSVALGTFSFIAKH